MRITWINPATIIETNGQRSSVRACVRLRSMIPGDELARVGHEVSLVSLDHLRWSMTNPEFFKRDVFVIGKAFADLTPVMRAARAAGARVIVDLCDNVFAPPEDGLKNIYRAILPHADAVVTSSEMLKKALTANVPVGFPVYVIADAVEGESCPPTFDPQPGRLRLLWFGYPNNLPLLHRELSNLSRLSPDFHVDLAVVTAWPGNTVKTWLPDNAGSITIRRVEWSPQAMRDELNLCDIVVVPSDDSPARLTKSANRVITGLWAGRYVVASPLPSYAAFGDFAGIGRDLVAGIQGATRNPKQILNRIDRGQRFISQHFSPHLIARSWEKVLIGVTAP